MEFFKKIKNSVLGFLGLKKVKVQEVEAKIEKKIEVIESTIKQKNKPIVEKPLEIETTNKVEKLEKPSTEVKETVKDIKSRSRKKTDTKTETNKESKGEKPSKKSNRRRPRPKQKPEGQ